ncbi:Zn-dependent exopeptidase [Lentithecium fluviatile CBS 122367]|uniref:Peptide hydrolase n=1 Tax=Lentithecium fluviatile CBS 122367 TaxID=1168545 RepID=A0A6G1JDJ4_9PLEO|nr:Zn-dependent exopeptidase [Lentithecium fluviatile CBS 122367]
MKVSVAIGAFAAAASAAVVSDTEARGGSPPGYGYGGGHGGNGDKWSKLPLVNSKKLQGAIKSGALLNGAKTLEKLAYSTPGRNRQMGTKGHNLTTDYLVKELKKLDGYYKVETQIFWAIVQRSGNGSLLLDGEPANSGLFDYSASGNVSAPLVIVNNLGCAAEDYPAELVGNVALIKRGDCEFGFKSAMAGAAGAVGALIWNRVPGKLEGTLGLPGRPEGPYIPTLGLSDTQGADLVAAITSGATITASLDVVTDIQNSSTVNVLATTNNGNLNTRLELGAHTDSVAAGPGINDDGSGTIGILEVAKALSKYKVNNAVRFGWWSGEEIDLLGSAHYVATLPATEQAKIRAYLNFDMIASPNYVYAIYDGDGSAFNETGPAGSAEIEHFFQRFFTSKGENYTATAFDGRSDYGPFLEINVPSGGTFTGAEEIKTEEDAAMFGGTVGEAYDKNYHQAGDNINAKAIAAAVAEYAVSFKGLPPAPALAKRSLGVVPRKQARGRRKMRV